MSYFIGNELQREKHIFTILCKYDIIRNVTIV